MDAILSPEPNPENHHLLSTPQKYHLLVHAHLLKTPSLPEYLCHRFSLFLLKERKIELVWSTLFLPVFLQVDHQLICHSFPDSFRILMTPQN